MKTIITLLALFLTSSILLNICPNILGNTFLGGWWGCMIFVVIGNTLIYLINKPSGT